MKIRIKNIPAGYELKNNKLVKKMQDGGTVNSTLRPVKRDEANVEAEKNETVLTDADQDGFYELYNVGGKRHSQGGTPLNLPEQSFIFSDTRKMKFTKDELKELGITSKKRLTPAAVSKKFPVNKYMEILKDPASDKIAIQSAEAMIKKNKLKLSQIAFMQERKKDFEEGLPLAAYPYLLENGIDPKEFEAKIEQSKQADQKIAQGSQQGMPTHTMPDGTVHPGATHEEYMAMQQGQGMPPQGPPMQGPPQGMMPPMPPQGQMPMAQDGTETDDPYTRDKINVLRSYIPSDNTKVTMPFHEQILDHELGNVARSQFVTDDMVNPINRQLLENPMLREDTINRIHRQSRPTFPPEKDPCEEFGPESKQCWDSKQQSPAWAIDTRAALNNPNVTFDDWMQYQRQFASDDRSDIMRELALLDPQDADYKAKRNELRMKDMKQDNAFWMYQDYMKDRFKERDMSLDNPYRMLPPDFRPFLRRQQGGVVDSGPTVDCTTTVCEYEQWLAQYRLKDIPEVRFMYESYKTKAIDKLKAPNIDTRIMPGHENLKNMPYGNITGEPEVGTIPGWKETLKGFIPDQYDYVVDDPMQGIQDFGNYIKDNLLPFQQGGQLDVEGNPLTDSQKRIQTLTSAQQQLQGQRLQIIQAFRTNPELQNNIEAQAQLEETLARLDENLLQVQSQLQLLTDQEFLSQTTIPLNEFTGETTENPMLNNSEYDYFDPSLIMPPNVPIARRGGSIGRAIPRFDNGGGNDEYVFDHNDPFYYGEDDGSGYPISLNPYHRQSPTSQYNTDGTENPNYDEEFETKVDEGIKTHETYYDIMSKNNFKPVREQWIKEYRNLQDPNKITKIDGKDVTDQQLFRAFNDMNILFTAAWRSGIRFKDGVNFDDQIAAHAKKLGMPVPDENTIKMYQGMYNALATAKLTGPQNVQDLLKQVNIKFSDNTGGAYEIVPNSGKFVSNIDGKVGDNTSQQWLSINDDTKNKTIINKNPCPEKEKRAKMQDCMEKGLPFVEEICDCGKVSKKTPPGEIPPYLTFPGDDMKVGALSALSLSRDKKYGRLRNYDPIMRDPGYVDDRAAVAATTALANQAMDISRDPSQVQGTAQDKIDQIQAKRWATNTKIFDNTQAYNVAEINKAREMNEGYMNDYIDMVNLVDQNYDNVKAEDMMNLVDAEITRMDNADKLYELNLRNPNYYFNPQLHKTIFQNPEALEAFRGNPNAQPVDMATAISDCRDKYGITDETQLIKCAELRMKTSNSPQNIDYTRNEIANANIEGNNEENTEGRYGGSYKYGGSIREKDLMRSKMNLRKWILGVK